MIDDGIYTPTQDRATCELFLRNGQVLIADGSQKAIQDQLTTVDAQGRRFIWLSIYSIKRKVWKTHGIAVSAIDLVGPTTLLSDRERAVETHRKVQAAMAGNFAEAEGVTWQDVKDAEAGAVGASDA